MQKVCRGDYRSKTRFEVPTSHTSDARTAKMSFMMNVREKLQKSANTSAVGRAALEDEQKHLSKDLQEVSEAQDKTAQTVHDM